MSEEEIMKGNLKLSVFNTFPYEELKKICDAICNFGYDCRFADNGNVIFQKKEGEKTAEPKSNPANQFKAREQQKKEKFIPTKEQEEKWAKEKITDNQKGYLGKLGYEGDPAELSKLEAFKLIKQIEEGAGDPEDEGDMYL
jgi:hypothetical protein